MKYAKLNFDSTFANQVNNVITEWDAYNYCTPEALIKDGKAGQFNVVPLAETPQPEFDPLTQICVQDGAELIDGAWQTKWLISDLTPAQIEAIRKASIPQSVTMRQARLALHFAGLLPGVSAAIDAMSEPDKTAAQITWEFASTVDRGFGMVPALASAMGMTEIQIDELFLVASQL